MNLNDLRALGAFIPAEPEKVQIEWKGQQFDIHVKRLAYADLEHFSQGVNPGVALLSAAVLMGDDKEPLSAEDAGRLDVNLAQILANAVNKVNGVDSDPN